MLCLYVDDILIFGSNLNVIEEVKNLLSSNFEIKDLGEADGFSDCDPAPTPYDPSMLLRKNQRIARDQLTYSQIIDSLMYLASATRPNISYAVSKLSRFVSKPGDGHCVLLRECCGI
jgi:hypothetical protein